MLSRWLLASEWREHPLRMAIAILAIALGVALGYAIDLINRAAVEEFSAGVKSLSGQSELQVRASLDHFDEKIFPLLVRHPLVANAYPILETRETPPGQTQSLTLLGIDALRAGGSDLVGTPQPGQWHDLLAEDSLFLSPAAQSWLKLSPGQSVDWGGHHWRIAGGVANARPGQRIGIIDIASAQWRSNHLGQLSRIELRLVPGLSDAARKAARQQLAAFLQPYGQFSITELEQREQRASNLSRAYRVNLSLLALIALLTGAFLVFSNQALSVIRRRAQFALLRVLGWQRSQLLWQIVLEGGLLGLLGALAGIGIGYALADFAVRHFGADLGAGYFADSGVHLQFQLWPASFFALLGLLVALAGAALPAWHSAQLPAAASLKAGEASISPLRRPYWALASLLLAALFSQLPPVSELPLFAYLAIGLLLIGSITLLPHLCQSLFSRLLRWQVPHPLHTLALARLANHPGQASIALAGLLASFSLMVSMAIMVHSFRGSLDQWLQQVLPADLYLRAHSPLDPAQQQKLKALPALASFDAQRSQSLTLDANRAPVVLLARALQQQALVASLPTAQIRPDLVPIQVSEAMPDLYGYTLGKIVRLPLGKQLVSCQIVGIWRDYARQFGSIIVDGQRYRQLSGDLLANEAAMQVKPGYTVAMAINQIRALPFGNQVDLAEPGFLRQISLQIFDRSFAVTWVLEAIAIMIGLFGVATSFSAQTLARSTEFGMLRHLGYQRRQILQLLALEGAWLGGLGVLGGFVVGFGISLILVFIVNPQSFHWHMQMALPWPLLSAMALLLASTASLTALFAARHAVAKDALLAVREDW
jgi:putative ABC transport system permease protein